MKNQTSSNEDSKGGYNGFPETGGVSILGKLHRRLSPTTVVPGSDSRIKSIYKSNKNPLDNTPIPVDQHQGKNY